MYATWALVVSALIAGLVGGFLIPDRPQSRPAAVVNASAILEPVNEAVTSSRSVNRRTTGKNYSLAAHADRPSATRKHSSINAKTPSCAIDSWPYRAPGCLDRAAALEPGYSVVEVKRVDPVRSLAAEVGRRSAENHHEGGAPRVVIRGPSGRDYLVPRYGHVTPPSY